ncbi:MAG: hypothetical protein ACLTKG_06755 [Collinsella intestinalis]
MASATATVRMPSTPSAVSTGTSSIYYVYTTDVGCADGRALHALTVVAEHTDRLKDLAYRDVVWVARTSIRSSWPTR